MLTLQGSEKWVVVNFMYFKPWQEMKARIQVQRQEKSFL
jgi:hypothetical protein